ncbi:hypothetical protein K1X84_10040 [bacterium]|nr:hypothetical protein [bacterium]
MLYWHSFKVAEDELKKLENTNNIQKAYILDVPSAGNSFLLTENDGIIKLQPIHLSLKWVLHFIGLCCSGLVLIPFFIMALKAKDFETMLGMVGFVMAMYTSIVITYVSERKKIKSLLKLTK